MPRKGRKDPCHDPLKRGHAKESQYKDVNTCSTELLNYFRKNLPKYKWKDGTRMCSACRAKAFKICQKQEDLAKGVVECGNLLRSSGKNLQSNV